MKAYISSDERFPDYWIEKMDDCYNNAYDVAVNIPDELFYKLVTIQNMYNDIQDELEKLINTQKSDGFL